MTKNKEYLVLVVLGLILGTVAGKLGVKYAFLMGAAVLIPFYLTMKPQVGLYLLASYSVLDYVFRLQGGIMAGLWDELLFIGIVATYLLHLIVKNKKINYRFTNLDIPILIFFAISIFLVLVNAPDLSIAIDGIRVILQYLLWYFIAVNLIKDGLTVKRILNVMIFTTGMIALYGIYQYVVGVEIPTSWYDSRYETSVTTRVFSIIGSPNILGSLLVMMIPINLAFTVNEQRWVKKIIYFATMMAMLLCLVFTLSRGAWLAFALAAVIYALIKDKRLIIPLAVGVAIIMVVVPQIGDRIAYMLSPQYMISSSTGGRIARWTLAIEAIKSSPLFGVGIGRFGGATAMRHIPGSFYADNFYLKTFAEMGIIGFTAFLYLLYKGCIESLREIRLIKDREFYNIGVGVFTGIIGVLAHNAVENVFEVPMMTSYFWLLVAIIISFRFIAVTSRDKAGEITS